MRVLFTSAAGLGHIFPLVPLARAAQAAGDEVLFAVPREGLATLEGFGFAASAIPDGDPAELGRAWANLPDHNVNTYVIADVFVRIQGLAALPALQTAIKAHRADVVITTDFGAIVAAEKCGLPNALVGITALDLDDLDLARVGEAVDDLRTAVGLPRTGKLPYANGTHYLSAIPPVLWADESHLPPGWLWYRHEDPEGSVAPAQPHQTDGRPRVYATLGSMAAGSNIGQTVFGPVLSALGQLDGDVLFTIGRLEPESLGAIPANVTVAGYVPQAEAMICDVVVSHAGTGTTVAGLARGLPMVAIPMFADQSHNADRLTAAGIGLRVDPGRVGDELTSAVQRVLGDPMFLVNAFRVAEEIANRPTPAEAVQQIRTVVSGWNSNPHV